MSGVWRTIRVFISSTFKDMQAERDHLVRFVFPRLREQLLPRRIHLVDVDLRWGVTSEQDASEVCREIITECRPRFLCMLGGRYGTIPEGRELSITDDEVHFGALDADRQKIYALFYFRHGAVTKRMDQSDPGSVREPRDDDSKKAVKLARLKCGIRRAKCKPFLYRPRWNADEQRLLDLKAFGDRVARDILATIDDEFGTQPPEQLDEFAEENAAMEAFVEERSERFVLGSREAVLNELLAHASATGGNGYVCITGSPGSGKSALLAHLSQHSILNNQSSTILIRHFVGASPGSTDVRRTLRQFCYELKKGCPGITADIPDDPEKLRVAFSDFLRQACVTKRVVILLDAANQFDSTSHSAILNWLPEELPDNARVILSALDEPSLEDLRRRRCKPHEIKLQPLTIRDAAQIRRMFLRRYRKRLSREQRRSLMTKTDAGTPLYLLAALEELRTLGTYEEITRRIAELPPTTHELFKWILERLENDDGFRNASGRQVGHELVSRFAALLGASRHGLSHRELVDLLDPGDLQGNVAALLHLLRPYLMRRGELLDFYHGQFRSAAREMCLSRPDDRVEAHQSLAEFFRRIADSDGNRTWRAPQFVDGGASGIHALEEVSFHAYQFALESGKSSLLFAMADDAHLRKRQFEHYGSPMQSIELIGYSLEVAAAAADLVQLVHFTMLRTSFAASLARSYLYRLPEVVRDKGNKQVELARAVVRLIPEPAQRRLGFLLVAWMLRGDSIHRPLVLELISEALRIELQTDVCQSALLLEIVSGLCQEGFVQAAALLDWVPPSPILEGYRRAWSGGAIVTRELAERIARPPVVSLSIPQTELEEYQRICQFTQRFAAGVKPRPWPNSRRSTERLEMQLCERFGLSGAAGAYFIIACDQIQSGNDRMAEAIITRGIYLCTSLPRPAQRTLAATVQAFGMRGEIDMSREQEARVRTLNKIATRMARAPLEKAQLEDERRELMIATDILANTWRAPGARDLFQQAVCGHVVQTRAGTADHTDVLALLANARLLVAEGRSRDLPGLLSEVLTVIPEAPQNQQPELLLAIYCLARACHDTAAMRYCDTALARHGLRPESLFPEVGGSLGSITGQATILSQEVAQTVAILAAADPRCIAAVAMSLRINGQIRMLLELIWRVAYLGMPVSTMDPLLCELVQLPGLALSDLRQISDEVLFTGRRLTIPSGLGCYYYPGIMLVSAWTGGVLMAVAFSAALNWGVLFSLVGIILVAGVVGAFADFWLWHRMGLWKRPEKSRRFIAELGTIAIFWAATLLIKPYLPESMRQSGAVGVGILVGLAAEGLLTVGLGLRGLLFSPWHAKGIVLGSAVACLAGTLASLAASWLPGGETPNHVLAGLFLAGGFTMSIAMNIFPKHLVCIRHFGRRGNYEIEEAL